jgi:hypothetical protein
MEVSTGIAVCGGCRPAVESNGGTGVAVWDGTGGNNLSSKGLASSAAMTVPASPISATTIVGSRPFLLSAFLLERLRICNLRIETVKGSHNFSPIHNTNERM